MTHICVSELCAAVESIHDPVLKGKIAKALDVLHRTFALYKCAPFDPCSKANGSERLLKLTLVAWQA